VLRRIIRRAIRHGYKLGARKPFFHKLVATLVAEMGEAYPELRRDRQRVTEVLQAGGGALLPDHRQRHGDPEGGAGRGHEQVDGDTAFKLHDTYGFPLDLTADVCRERGVTVDEAGFDAAMAASAKARAAGKFKMAKAWSTRARHHLPRLRAPGVRARQVTRSTSTARGHQAAKAGDDAVIVLDHTPFYAESGGQVGDTGELRNAVGAFRGRGHHQDPGRRVRPPRPHRRGHEVNVGDTLAARVDAERGARPCATTAPPT
jgi:alanyl-tRNA synthetase